MKNVLLLNLFFAFISLNVNAQPEAVFSADVTEGCDQLTVQFTDASTPAAEIVTWQWDLGDGYISTDQNPNHIYLNPGFYTICLTVANGLGEEDMHCETDYINIVETPIADAGSDGIINCFAPTFVLDGSNSSSGPNITHEWQDPNGTVIGDTSIVEIFQPGPYTLIVTNAGVCSSTSIVTINEEITPPIANIAVDSSCGSHYTLTVGGSSTGPNISYEWFNENGILIGTEEERVLFQTGIYSLVVTDQFNGCNNTVQVEIENFGNSIISINDAAAIPVECFGGNNGSIYLLDITGGQFPYEYLWSTGANSQNIFDLQAGTYSVTVIDANGCTVEEAYVVNELMLEVFVSVSWISCFGASDGSIEVLPMGGTPPYTYNWADLAGTDNPQDRFDLEAGVYTVTVSDLNDCTAEYTNTILEPSELVLTVNTTCSTTSSDGQVNVVVTGGTAPYLYEWTNGILINEITDLIPGVYGITITDSEGCSVTEDIEIGTAITELIGGDTTYCDFTQQQLEVIAPTAVTYEWSPGNLSCYDCANPIATVGLGEETFYSVTVTEADGCIDIGYINFNVQSYLDFNLLQFSNSPIFAGDDLEFNCNVFNPSSVTWTGPAGFSATECNPIISNANSANAGTYTLDIIDQYGCVANANPEVVFYEIIESISNDTSVCIGELVQLEVVAPTAVSYEWSPAIGLNDSTIPNPICVAPGTDIIYTVIVEDVNGFSESISVTVYGPPFDLEIDGPSDVCEGEGAEICYSGIAPGVPGVVVWTGPNGDTIPPVDNCIILESGFLEGCYTCQITLLGGCILEETFCIGVFDPVIVSLTMDDTICRGENIELSMDVVDLPIFEWEPAEFLDCNTCPNPIASLLETTTFSVTVTSIDGCQEEDSFEVIVDQGCVWPGDTDTSKVVNNFDLLNIGLAYDSIGPVRPDANLSWLPQPMEDWSQSTPDDVNYKHVDTDGNGMINSDDTLAITLNWGSSHNFTEEEETQLIIPDYPQSGFTAIAPFYIEPDTLIENESYALPVILGEEGSEMEDLYGLAFSIEYDSSIIVPGSASIGFDGWIGQINDDMLAIQRDFIMPGRVDVGITRIDGMPMDGFGQIGLFYITIEDDVLLRNPDGSREDELEVLFDITNVLVINNLGEAIPVVPLETTTILEEPVSTQQINWEEYIQVSPNPAEDILLLTTKNIEIENVKLYSITGELLMNPDFKNATTEINVSQLNIGIYLLEVQTDLGVMVEKVMVVR